MTATQDIQFGITGQTLILDCEDGRPASVTSVTVYEADADDTAQAETATTGVGSVETNPNTTLSASAGSGVNPATVSVTAATGVTVGRSYRITDASGLYEDVMVHSLSGTTVTLRSPLINDYASGAAFVSTRATIALSATWIAATENASPAYTPNPRYRVRWVVVDAAGLTQVYHRFFDLVRYPARHGVTPTMMESRHPGWLDALPIDQRATQGRTLIDRAFAQVKHDLYADGKADQSMRNAELVAELVVERAAMLAVGDAILAGAVDQGQRYDAMAKLYEQRYVQVIRAPVMPVDTSGGGGSAAIVPERLWRR